METLEFSLNGHARHTAFKPILVGVVGSGNLEVMMEQSADPDHCRYVINTSARGFAATWQAVVSDFHRRHQFGGVLVSINDMGATPAVVSLRLDQAAACVPPKTGQSS